MAFRLLEYTGMIYRRLLRADDFAMGHFPEILTLVLYNGSQPWSAPLDVWSYLTPVATSRRQDSPQLRYQLISILKYEDSFLEALRNPVGWLMLMEKHASQREVLEALAAQVDNWAQHENQEPVREVFETFLWELSRQERVKGLHWEATGLSGGAEVMHMGLAEGLRKIHTELLMQGRIEGRQEGEKRGEQRGEQRGEKKGLRRAVQSVLKLKFGAQGLQFWKDKLEGADFHDWLEILEFAENADTLVEFAEKMCPPPAV